MKYIRTKDDIYQVRKPALDEYLWEDATYVYMHEHIDNKDIIKRADTIEELCDKWIYDDYANNKNIIKDIGFASLETMKRRFEKGIVKNVRLTIWIDKGLIYVAKMNDKGELELL